MENKFTLEQIEKAKECKSIQELLTLAKENEMALAEAEAKNLFAQLNPENGEMSDNELEAVAGGCDSDKEKFPHCPDFYPKNSSVDKNKRGCLYCLHLVQQPALPAFCQLGHDHKLYLLG